MNVSRKQLFVEKLRDAGSMYIPIYILLMVMSFHLYFVCRYHLRAGVVNASLSADCK